MENKAAALPAHPNSGWHSWLDYARVLATIIIVLFHIPSSPFAKASSPAPAAEFLSFFGSAGGALAFFFITAGYLTNRLFSWSKWGNKLLLLLFPYLTWNVLCAPGLDDSMTFCRVLGIGAPHIYCADYPLWFVHNLIIFLLLYPLYRRLVPLLALICGFFMWMYDNQWPWEWMAYIPMPKPSNWLLFLAGWLVAHMSLEGWKVFFLWSAPIWWTASVLNLYHVLPLQSFASLNGAFCLFSAGTITSALLPASCEAFTRLASKASFLCYAVHAPVILLLGRLAEGCCPGLCLQSWVYYALPLSIYAASTAGYKLMEKYLPAAMPFLAHHGKLPWNSKEP